MGVVHAKAQRPKEQQIETKGNRTEIQLEGIPCRVDRIHVNGLARTKDDIVQESVKELFQATDFQDVIVKVHDVKNHLDSLGCFRNIGVYIDTSKGPNATEDGLEITFMVREMRRVAGSITSSVGNNEGALVVGMKLPNLFGRGERVQTEFSYGSKKSNNFNLQFIKPFLFKYNNVFTSSVYQTMADYSWSGYKQIDRGVLFDFAFNSTPLLKHNIQWDAAIRDLSVLSFNTSFPIREQSGLTLKSSIKHILTLDQRDEPIFPTYGVLLQITSELAGFGGDIGFLKNELKAQANYSIFENVVFQLAAQAGFLRPMSIDKNIMISDQFFLGGPLTLRGFQTRGIGPHSDEDALGSDIYWSSGLHLYTPLPFRPGRGGLGDLFRTHFFLNAGNVAQLKLDKLEDTYNELVTKVRVTYGLGIAVRVGQMARIELNYCFPLSYQRGDKIEPGIQYGVGVHFL